MAKTPVKKAATPVVAVPDQIVRVLSNVVLINSGKFDQLTALERTKRLAVAVASGQPIEFVQNFTALEDRKAIRDNLLLGKDVSREMEFNGIELSVEEIRSLSSVTDILKKIIGDPAKYPWIADNSLLPSGVTITHDTIRRNDHRISLRTAKTIWNRASKFWAMTGDRPKSHSVTPTNSYQTRAVSYTPAAVTIGCQSFSRKEVEQIARNRGWEPSLV